MRSSSLINIISFQLGWWTLVISARSQNQEWGLLLALTLFVLHFLFYSNHRRRDHWLVKIIAIWGFGADVFLIKLGLMSFPPSHDFPYWLVGMWILFPLTLPYSFHKLLFNIRLRPLLALGAALSYLAGEGLGVLIFPFGWLTTGIILTGIWLVNLSLFAWLLNYLQLRLSSVHSFQH